MTAADAIRLLLISLNQGADVVTGSWPIFVGLLPDLPDDALCIYDTAGKLDGRLMSTGEQIEHPGIQIRARGRSYPTTYDKLRDVVLALDSQFNSIVSDDSGSYTIQNVCRDGGLLPLGIEDSDRRRYHFSVNATITIHKQD